MFMYASIVNEQTGLCNVGLGTNSSFYQALGMELLDVTKSDIDNMWYLTELCPLKSEEEKKQEEKQRIQNLSMTRSDFFDGTIKAFGIGYKELHVAIENLLVILDMPEVDKKVALNNFENALNFYRKHPLFNMISNVEFPVYDGLTVFITVDQWDKFFDETSKGNTDAYKELLPKL